MEPLFFMNCPYLHLLNINWAKNLINFINNM